jgi:hypothetical protein
VTFTTKTVKRIDLAELNYQIISLSLAIILSVISPDSILEIYPVNQNVTERLYRTSGIQFCLDILQLNKKTVKLQAYKILITLADQLPQELISSYSEIEFDKLITDIAGESDCQDLKVMLYAIIKRHSMAFEKIVPNFSKSFAKLVKAILVEVRGLDPVMIKQLRDDKAMFESKR